MSNTRQQLLDLAEDRIRLRGFHAVSFRDLADELGIKSSSVHYYYPQKQDLGVALVKRYSDAFFQSLEEAASDAGSAQDFIEALISVYWQALIETDRICLCGILGAESDGIPKPVAKSVSQFLSANVDWLHQRLNRFDDNPNNFQVATRVVSTLQGAMMIANTLKSHEVFKDAVQTLRA